MHTGGTGSTSGPRGRDLILPLDVTLEELYRGGVRRTSVNLSQLRRARRGVTQDTFEVRIGRGAPDGSRVTFHGAAVAEFGAESGDVVFVLQERQHPRWRRKGLDLYTERTITLLEALTGYSLVIEHLDGRRLVVRSAPGEIVRPRNLLPGAEAAWERFDDTDAFPGLDAGSMRTDDLEACKEACRQKGFSGFTYWEDAAYFRAQGRADLLASRAASRGSTLFVCPDPQASASVRMQRAIRGAGMPSFRDPMVRGNLFLLLRVSLPADIGERAAELLRGVLPAGASSGAPPHGGGASSEVGLEEKVLCDLDPLESQRRHHIATGGQDDGASASAGSRGLPPLCRQM